MPDTDHSDENPVIFKDAEFGRMVRCALGRSETAPVYPSELSEVSSLSIRCGNMLFSSEIQSYQVYDQPDILNLTDLKLFPALQNIDITDII